MRRENRGGRMIHGYQYHLNQKLAASHVENERGWRIPNTVEEGFEALNLSLWWLHYRVLWFHLGVLSSTARDREEAWHNARIYLNRARQCPRPRLP